MAQIDIKNCDVYIEDGYDGPGGAPAVNLMAGYMIGATTMAIDGVTGALAVGDRFTVAGDTVIHTISAHTETSSNTTSITFAPALGAAVVDDAVITILPRSLKVRIGEGNCSWTEKRPVTYVKDRGKLDTVRLGDQEPVEVKMDATWEFLTSLSGDLVPTIEEALKRTGPASNWVSSSADECEPYAVNIRIEYVPPCSIAGERYILHDYRYEDIGHDLKTGQLTMSGKCNNVESTNTRLE